MKTIKIWEKSIELTIGEQLTVREMRLIYPITKKYADNEIEMSIQIIKALSNQSDVEEIINSLSLTEFQELSEEIAGLLSFEKKK